jgi:dTDP-glucose 4,6-dehydratase
MKYVVTGGCGFIGSNYVRGLLTDRWGSNVEQVTVIDSLTYAGNLANLDPVKSDPRLTFVREDIANQNEIAQILHGHDIVVHFAAESHVDRSISGSAEFIRTNVLGTHSMLQASLNADIKQFLHVSTDEVYGSISEGSWDEQEPLLPNSPYAASKASSDLIARSFFVTHGLDVRITRCSNNFGIYQYPEKVIPLFITNLITGKKVPLYGDGKNIRDWLHVDDHCRGIAIVCAKGEPGQAYNIGGGLELNNREITERVLDAMGADWSSVKQVEDRKGHDRRYSVDDSRLRAMGYAPQHTFDDGLAETVAWYKNNEAWWRPLKAKAAL